MRFSRSAPENPAVVWAICFRFTSSPRALFLACTRRIASRPRISGRLTITFRSNLPGRRMAGSRISTRFVAAMTIMPSLTPKPSISTSSWFSVCSLSSCPPPMPVPLRRPTASISSIKMMQGAFFFASANRSRTREAPTPTNISTKSEPEMEKKGTPASPATALARSVFPVPGCPTRIIPLGILAPSFVYFAGFRRKSTISSRSSFSSAMPATSEKRILLSRVICARLFPKSIILAFAPPPVLLPIMLRRTTTSRMPIIIGSATVSRLLSCETFRSS